MMKYLNPAVDGIVLWFDRVVVAAVIHVIGGYHNNGCCIKFASEIDNLEK